MVNCSRMGCFAADIWEVMLLVNNSQDATTGQAECLVSLA